MEMYFIASWPSDLNQTVVIHTVKNRMYATLSNGKRLPVKREHFTANHTTRHSIKIGGKYWSIH